MAKLIAQINLELTKPTIVGADFDLVKAWIQTNVIDKLPTNAQQVHFVTYQP
jgi:hypothetical protein